MVPVAEVTVPKLGWEVTVEPIKAGEPTQTFSIPKSQAASIQIQAKNGLVTEPNLSSSDEEEKKQPMTQ